MMSMHRDSPFREHDIARGYIVVREVGDWIYLAHPGRTCLKQLRDGLCEMDKDHRGRCSVVTFSCDSCGHTRRGEVYRYTYDSAGDRDTAHCWFCVNVLNPRS